MHTFGSLLKYPELRVIVQGDSLGFSFTIKIIANLLRNYPKVCWEINPKLRR